MRPTYVTQTDHRNEDLVIGKVVQAWGVTAINRAAEDKFYSYDAEFYTNGKLTSMAEIKRRNMYWKQHPDVTLAVQKAARVVAAAKQAGVRPLFMVLVNGGGVYWADITRYEELPITEKGGRTLNTRDPKDIEPCVGVPNDWFHPLEEIA